MKIIQVKDYQEMSAKAAELLADRIRVIPNSVLGLATGSTPIGTYEKLIKMYEGGELDFSQVRTVNLDEYVGLSRENEQSYYYYMKEHLFKSININKENTHLPNGMSTDNEQECKDYEALIDSLRGIDVQLLGIGHNGHIGFNEPSTHFPKATHCVDLAQSTIEANKRFFASVNDVPRQAYTMGIGTIMMAKAILLIASGEDKATILSKALFGEITPSVPASVLQLHRDVTVITDIVIG